MFGSMRSVFVLVLAGGLTWSCSDERVMTPQVTQTGEQIVGPLSKPAVRRDVTQAVVVVTVQQDGAPVSGATVELSRSVSGRAADYAWSGTTDEDGQAKVYIGADNVSGYYQARAMQDGSLLGSWSSIPINGGYESMVDLPVGGKARVTGSSVLTLQSVVGSWVYVGTDMIQTISENLLNALVAEGVDSTTAVFIIQEVVGDAEDSIGDEWSSIRRFNEDGSFEDQDSTGTWSDMGVWSVSGNLLTMVDEEGFTIEGTYFVDGDNLTFSFTKDQYIQIVKQQNEEWDEETQELFDAMLREGDTIRLFFRAAG